MSKSIALIGGGIIGLATSDKKRPLRIVPLGGEYLLVKPEAKY